MSRREIEHRARLVIACELGVPIERVREGSDFRADLGADSLDLVQLPAALEDEFKVQLSDDEVEFCATVGTAIDIIEAKLEQGTTAPPFLRQAVIGRRG